jgi:hypothetical protein
MDPEKIVTEVQGGSEEATVTPAPPATEEGKETSNEDEIPDFWHQEDGGNGKEDEGGDEENDEDRKIIDDRINKKLAPYQQEMERQRREGELSAFLNSEDGKMFKDYEGRIRKVMLDPRAKSLKVDAIASIVAAKDLLKMGAKMGKEADIEADATRSGGGNQRPTEAKSFDAWSMPKESFNDTVERMKRGEKIDGLA